MEPMRLICSPLAVFLVLAGCGGSIEEPTGSGEEETVRPGEDPSSVPPPEVEELVLPSERLRLLPFDVRLARIAAVVGVATTDPLLERLVARRVELGAPDYANGIQADAAWNASKIALWADQLEPICASEQMRTRYPSFPESLGPLIEATYGRRMVPEDETALAPLDAAAIDPERRYVLTCMTVLSGAEMVLQ
jgi:hypothetical protein